MWRANGEVGGGHWYVARTREVVRWEDRLHDYRVVGRIRKDAVFTHIAMQIS
jgi:hypothetical protein